MEKISIKAIDLQMTFLVIVVNLLVYILYYE